MASSDISSIDLAARHPQQLFSVGVAGVLKRYLTAAQIGTLTVTLPSGLTVHHRGTLPGPEAVLNIRRWRTLRRMMLAGALGLARAYMDDDCRSPDIRALLDFGMQNEAALVEAAPGSCHARLFERLQHLRRANTRRGSRRNISAHYDLGNAFYALWLDRDYSSALFTHETQTLEEAQNVKLDRIIELLDVERGQNILEIGCGWGPLAERLVSDCGCRVTALTLSSEQLAFAEKRLRRRTSNQDWNLLLQDYRDVDGRYVRWCAFC